MKIGSMHATQIVLTKILSLLKKKKKKVERPRWAGRGGG